MLSKAIEKITELARAKTFEVDGRTFADGELHEVIPEVDVPNLLPVNSLDELIHLIQREGSIRFPDAPLFVSVRKYNEVVCYTPVSREYRNDRLTLYVANATDIPGLNSESKFGFEQAQIALQTRFQHTADRDYLLRLCSQITCGGKVTYNDNGIATSVVTQKGVALQGTEAIKPLVLLKPYRTFQEVEQPESLFLVRVDERGVSFIEADGGMWKLKARETIKKFLVESLADLISENWVVVTL